MFFREISFGSKEYNEELELREQYLRIPLGFKHSEEDLAGEDHQIHFGLFEERRLYGCVVAKKINEKKIKLRQMIIHPSVQGKGLGKALIKQVEEVLKKRGFEEIILNARIVAKTFYQKCGYQSYGEEFIEQSIPHIQMRKLI